MSILNYILYVCFLKLKHTYYSYTYRILSGIIQTLSDKLVP